VLRERVRVLACQRLVCAREFLERRLERGELLGAELGEGGERVGDAEEGVAVPVEFEVFGALRDELGGLLVESLRARCFGGEWAYGCGFFVEKHFGRGIWLCVCVSACGYRE
jgi:hypothetical protein